MMTAPKMTWTPWIQVYDPERGKSFSVEITLKDNATLSVRGYVGTKMLGETSVSASTTTTASTSGGSEENASKSA